MHRFSSSFFLLSSSVLLSCFHAHADNQPDFKSGKTLFTFYGEWLYFKAAEDSLKYAQRTPQNPTFTPKSKPVYQDVDYASGLRVGSSLQFHHYNAELGADWMWYAPEGKVTKSKSDNFSVVAILALPTYGIDQNSQVDKMQGKWKLKMNSIDIYLKMPLRLAKWFTISPYGGTMASFIDQNVLVKYEGFEIFQPTANTPQKIIGKNNMWGVGPLLGLDMKFFMPHCFDIFFNGAVAGLCSQFKLDAVYRDFINAPSYARLDINDRQFRISLYNQLRAGIEANFRFRSHHQHLMELSFSAGWEVQVWTRQFHLNLFSFVEPDENSNLTLSGPFLRGQLRF